MGGSENDPTPLQEKLEVLADDIGKFGMTMSTLIFCLMVAHLIAERLYYRIPLIDEQYTLFTHILEYFIIAIVLIVCAVPEGLPLAVVIALAFSVNKMKEENNLVRFLAACETMGGANNICSDKTGTLTQNIMKLKSFWCQ